MGHDDRNLEKYKITELSRVKKYLKILEFTSDKSLCLVWSRGKGLVEWSSRCCGTSGSSPTTFASSVGVLARAYVN